VGLTKNIVLPKDLEVILSNYICGSQLVACSNLVDEFQSLSKNGTWILIDFPPIKNLYPANGSTIPKPLLLEALLSSKLDQLLEVATRPMELIMNKKN
jgi:hypothetical protein